GAVEVVVGGGAVVGHPRRAGGELAHRAQVAATAGHERAARQREGQAKTPASVHGLLPVQVPRRARFRCPAPSLQRKRRPTGRLRRRIGMDQAPIGFGFLPSIPYFSLALATSLAVSLPSAARAATAACAM